MKKSTRLIILATLTLTICLTTTLSLVFWSNSQINTPDNTVNLPQLEIGTGASATLTINFGTTLRVGGGTDALIPQTLSPTSGQTTQIQYTVPVTWTAPAGDQSTIVAGKTGTLSASVNSIKVAGDAATDYKTATGVSSLPLFVVTFAHAPNTTITANSGTVTTTVTVKMNEPLDQTQYNAIAGKQITINLLFSVTPGW